METNNQDSQESIPYDPARSHSAVHMDLRIQGGRVYHTSDLSRPITEAQKHNLTRELLLVLKTLHGTGADISATFPPGIKYTARIQVTDNTFERGHRGGD